MERLVDAKAAPYKANPLVSQISSSVKAQYRKSILERARQALLAARLSEEPFQEKPLKVPVSMNYADEFYSIYQWEIKEKNLLKPI
jgi:hypothetical protein